MRAVPTPRRIALLALGSTLAIVLGACSSATLSPAPALPTASPAAVATNAPSPLPTAEPPPTCPAEPSQAELVFQTGAGFESIGLEAEPLATPEVVDAADVPIVVTVLGGIDHLAEVALDDGPNDTTTITTATADFAPFGTVTTMPVATNATGGALTLVLPDQPLAGQLRVSLSWSSGCGPGAGSGSIGMAVVESKVAEGCPTTAAGLDQQVAALDNQHITVSSLNVPLIITGWNGRWAPGAGAADIAQFAGWDRDHAAVAPARGANVVLSESVPALGLQSIQISIFLRADVDAYLDADSTGTLDTLTFVRRNANTKGRANIPAPFEPGRYVVEVVGTWLTPCLGLETYSAFSLEVPDGPTAPRV